MSFAELTLQILEVVFFEKGWVGKSPGRADALAGKLVAHIRRSVTDSKSVLRSSFPADTTPVTLTSIRRKHTWSRLFRTWL